MAALLCLQVEEQVQTLHFQAPLSDVHHLATNIMSLYLSRNLFPHLPDPLCEEDSSFSGLNATTHIILQVFLYVCRYKAVNCSLKRLVDLASGNVDWGSTALVKIVKDVICLLGLVYVYN